MLERLILQIIIFGGERRPYATVVGKLPGAILVANHAGIVVQDASGSVHPVRSGAHREKK